MYTFKILFVISFVGEFVVAFDTKENQTLPEPRLTIFGATGVGKSSLANVLLGEDYDCDNCTFPICDNEDSCTKDTTYAIGSWVGQGSNFTVVDTPGYGDTDNNDAELMDEMVDALKENIKSTNGFLLMFKGTDNKFDSKIQEMLREFQAMFGTDFWLYTTIGVSFWPYDEISIQKRNDSGLDETYYCNEKNRGLMEHYDVTVEIPCVFIDSHAYLDSPSEKEAFDRETAKLWNLINGNDLFEFKDFQDILEELDAEKAENKRLHNIIDSNLTALWEAVNQVENTTSENLINVNDAKKTADDNEVRLDKVNESLDDATEEFNEATETLFESNEEMKINIKLLNEAHIISNTAIDTLSGKLELETTERQKGDQQLEEQLETVKDEKFFPIGTIIAWVTAPKGSGLSSPIPEGWVRCDGATITSGPWKGFKTPKLDDGRFLRGGTDADCGSMEEDAIRDHEHEDNGHQHDYLDRWQEFKTKDGNDVGRGTHWHIHEEQPERECSSAKSGLGGVKLDEYGNSIAADETRPKNMKVVWLIKIT